MTDQITSVTVGVPGPPGASGDSAYQTWLAAGNTGTINNYLASLVGAPGSAGATGQTGATGLTGAEGAPGLVAINTPVSGATGGKLLVTDSNAKAQEGPAVSLVVTGSGHSLISTAISTQEALEADLDAQVTALGLATGTAFTWTAVDPTSGSMLNFGSGVAA